MKTPHPNKIMIQLFGGLGFLSLSAALFLEGEAAPAPVLMVLSGFSGAALVFALWAYMDRK